MDTKQSAKSARSASAVPERKSKKTWSKTALIYGIYTKRQKMPQ